MGVPVTAIELRYRPADSSQRWRVQQFPPDTSVITLTGLTRGVEYEGDARSIGPKGQASVWVPVAWEVAGTNREGIAALPPVSAANLGSLWIAGTTVTYTSTSTTATISVSAGTLQMGDRQISYTGSSTMLTGSPNEERWVYLYYDDPFLNGGSHTLGVTTSITEGVSEQGRIAISALKVVFDSEGGSGGGGGGDAGGGGGGGGFNPPIQPL